MEISLAEARRINLAAQGFGRRPKRPTISHVRKVADRLLTLQLDSVNVLVRSHYLPAYSRLGPYRRESLDQLAYDRKELFECWGHASGLLPARLFPLMRHRMIALRSGATWSLGAPLEGDTHVAAVYAEIAERGPLAAGDLSDGGRATGTWWGWSKGKQAMEALLECGYVAVSGRRGFTRVYDLTERVIPQEFLEAPTPSAAEAQKELLVLSAGAIGVAPAKILEGYLGLHSFRIVRRGPDGTRPKPIWRQLLAELVEDGRLIAVSVEGWKEPGYMVPGTKLPRSVQARALLSPFDTFMRTSAELCCNFVNSLGRQLYVPAEKREYGYYVLPFLLGDTLVGRCDLKADRSRSALLVQSAYLEPDQDPGQVAAELADELDLMRQWLELDRIKIGRRGNLAATLRARFPR